MTDNPRKWVVFAQNRVYGMELAVNAQTSKNQFRAQINKIKKKRQTRAQCWVL